MALFKNWFNLKIIRCIYFFLCQQFYKHHIFNNCHYVSMFSRQFKHKFTHVLLIEEGANCFRYMKHFLIYLLTFSMYKGSKYLPRFDSVYWLSVMEIKTK